MSAPWTPLATWVDGRGPRERLFLFAAVLFALFGLWDLLLLQPLERAREEARVELAALTGRIDTDRQQIAQLSALLGEDPDADARGRHAALEAGLAGVEARIREASAALVGPVRMTRLLEDLVGGDGGLTLERLASAPPTAVATGPSGDGGDGSEPRALLYRHGLELEFSGGYLDLLDYLQAVEALPWRLFWDRLEVTVEHYPTMHARLRVYTLSLEEGWIGG